MKTICDSKLLREIVYASSTNGSFACRMKRNPRMTFLALMVAIFPELFLWVTKKTVDTFGE